MKANLRSSLRRGQPARSSVRRLSSWLVLSTVLTVATSDHVRAAEVTWDAGSGADFNWNTISNWNPDLLPGSGDNLFFVKPVPNPGASLTDPSVITLGSGELANALSFFAKYTLTGGDLTLTPGNGGAIRVTIGNTTTIESKLTGSAGLTKEGDGALILANAANDYTGTTTINSGSVIITNQGALGTDSSAVVVTGNATRAVGGGALVVGSGNNNLTGLTFTRDLALTGGGASGDGAAFNSVGNNTFAGNIVTGNNPAGLNPTSGTAITASGTRLASTFGTATISGGLTLGPSGQSTEFTGNGNWVINSDIDGAGNLVKTGNGLLILTGNNSFGGTLTSSGGYVRISSAANLGTSTSSGELTTNAGKTEIRTDAPDFTAATKVTQGTSGTASQFFLDREVGSTNLALNQTVNLGLFTLTASTTTRSLTINSRNGYGITFTGNMASGSQGAYTVTNNGNGLLTFAGNFYNTTNTTARALTITGSGDTSITGGILASGAAHTLTKSGTGTLTLTGTNSTYSGSTGISGGTLAIGDFRAITNNTAAVNINGGILSVVGNNLSGANVTTSKVINLSGTTGGATILANQSGTSPGLQFGANFTATGAGIKTLTLGGTNAQNNRISGKIVDSTSATALTKIDSGTWVLAGANTYTGVTTITNGILKLEANAAVSTVLPATNAITFSNNNVNAGGTLEFVGQDGVANSQSLGALTYAGSGGAATIKLTPGFGIGSSASLTFANLGTGAGGTVNFVGGDFTTNQFTISLINNLVTGDGMMTRSVYWNGADFAYRQGGVLRAPEYGVDAGTVTSSTALGSGHNEITGSFATNSKSISTLKINGAQTLTINDGQTLTISAFGLLATGGSSTITGGTSLTVGGTATLVVRVDGGADSLRIETPLTGFTGGLTKSGAGILILAGANTEEGAITIGEGTVRLSGAGVLGADNQDVNLRQGATLDLNGVDVSTIKSFNSQGTVTNSNATAATLTIGGTDGTGTLNGIIEDGLSRVSVIKTGTGAQTWNGLSTYTGATTIGSTGKVTVTSLANIGKASSIGAGDVMNNEASLVFNGSTGGLIYTGRDSISTNRLFTLSGSGATLDASGSNGSTLIFNNTANVAFGTAGDAQELILTGNSAGDNRINTRLLDNGAGALKVTKDNTGLWVLGGASNAYSGQTNLVRGTLRAVDGAGLSSNSALLFNSTGSNTSVLESTGSFLRPLGTEPGQVSWSAAANGGFAAEDSKLTVNIGGAAGQLTWATGGFVTKNLVLSSTTALSEVEIVNPIDLKVGIRTIQVDTNSTTNSDSATLSGVISGAAGSGLIKTGNGILRLLAANTYLGDTNINGGTIRAVNVGDSTSTASNFGTGAGKITLGTGGTSGTLAYVGSGETSDRLIRLAGSTASGIIESSGTGALILSNVVNVGTGAKTLFLRGDLNAANEITNALTNSGANALSVTKDDNGTWILSGQSTYTGTTTVSSGPLGLGADSVGAVGSVTSSPVGVTRLTITNGAVFAFNGDRTLNTRLLLSGNATSNYIGINSLTFNNLEGTTTGGNTTITNSLPTGELLTFNSPTFTGTETVATNIRTFVFNGSGETIFNSSVTDSTGGVKINLTYQGYGSLTLGGSNGGSIYTGATTISSGTLKVGSTDAIPNGAGKSNVTINPGTGLSATLDLNGFDQTINGLVANSTGTANIDNSAATPVTFTFGSQDQTANLIGGVTNSGGGALSLVKIGTAAATFNQGPFTYTGGTTVMEGSLTIASDVSGTTSLTVGANAFLGFTDGLSASGGITSVNVGAGAELKLFNSVGEPLNNLTSLTLGAGSTLDLNAGVTTDTLTLLAPNIASVGGLVNLNVRDTGSMLGGTTYNLLVAASGGLTTGGTSTGSYALTGIPGGFTTLTLNQSDTVVSLTTGLLVSDKRYWTGATNNAWNAVNGTFAGRNWSPEESGATVSAFIPGSGTTVVFSADNAAGGALVTTMEQGFRINALEFESSTTTATSVTINPGTDPTNRLIISPSNSADGINLKVGGPAAVTIAAPLRVDADQTWTVASSTSTLTLSGGLSGPGNLMTDGPGTIVVSAAAGGTFTVPTVTIKSGTLRTEDIAALGSTIAGNAAAITVNAGAAFYYFGATNGATTAVNNALTLNGGTLSAGGSTSNHYYTGAVNLAADSFINLRDSNSATLTSPVTNIVLSQPVTGAGKLTVDSNNLTSGGNQLNGILYFQGDNTGWTGPLNLMRGTVQVQGVNGFTSGDVTASAGRIQFNMPANNTVNLAQNFTVDAPGGILELSVDASGTLSGDLTINLNGVVTLGSAANANNALRISQASDNFSILNITNSIVLGNDASISYQGTSGRSFEISGVISESAGVHPARNLALNDDQGGWGVTNQTIVLSGANTFLGDITLASGTLQFSTVSNIGGAASNLGRGSAINITAASTLTFAGGTSQSTDRPITATAAPTLSANGTGGATITYSGAISTAGNTLTLTGAGEGFLTGGITQTGTAADVNVNSGIWHIGGVASILSDDITASGTAVLNFDTPNSISYTVGTSNGLYARDGAVINLNVDDFNGAANSGGLDFIFLGDTTSSTSQPGTLNTNGHNVTVPRLDLGGILPGRTGVVLGAGTITVTYTGVDYVQGIRLFDGSIAANLAGVAAVLKQGLDTVTLSGDNSGLTSTVAVTRIDSGKVILDYTTNNATKLPSSVGVDLRGATLQLVGNNGATTSETFSGLSLGNGGSNEIQVTGGTGRKALLNFGALTRANLSQDGTLRFILPAGVQDATNGILTTSPNSTSGLLGNGASSTNDAAYATVEDASGVWFATNVGGNIVPLVSTATNDVTMWTAGDHITDSMTGFTGTLQGVAINSLRFNAAVGSDVTLPDGGILLNASGGILVTSNVGGTPAILGGTLASGATEIVVIQDSTHAFEISSDIRINHALTKTGAGTLLLTGNNIYTGYTELQEGILQVSGGNAIGDTSLVTLSDDHATTLQLLSDETIGRLQGGSATTGLDQLAVVDIGSHTLTVNETGNTTYAGLYSGTGRLVKTGTGNFQQTNASVDFNGTITVNQGLFYYTSLGSSNATDYILNKGSSFMVDNNGTTSLGTHVLDTATITLNSADGVWSGETKPSGLTIRRDQASTQNETVGVITARSGANYARLEASVTGAITGIVADDIVRQNDATIDVRGTNLGATAARRALLRIGTSANETAFIAAMVGGSSTTLGTKNISIVPWAIAENLVNTTLGDGNMGNSLATYVAGQGFRALDLTTEYTTIALAGTTDNVRQSLSADLTGIAGKTINALVLDNAAAAAPVNVTGTGAGQTLVNTSGAFLFTVSNGVASTAYSTILGGFDSGITVGGTNEYVFFVVNPTSTATTSTLTAMLTSPLTSLADITKSGRGALILSGTNTAGGGTRTTTINEGILEISDLDNIGGNTGALVFAGGTLRLGTGLLDDISTRTISFFNGGGTIDTNGANYTLANSVGSGLGGLTKAGNGTLTLNAAATYSGTTTVSAGTLAIGANNAIGTGGDLNIGAGATLDIGTSSISAGLVTTSGAGPVIAGTGTINAAGGFAFNNTVNTDVAAILAGPGGLLKTQTNVLALTGLNTYTGTTEIQNGTVSFDSIGNVGGGASALGAPTTVEDGIIRVGLTTADPILTYTGTGHSTDRIIEIQGIAGGNVFINSSGTGALALGTVQTATIGDKTLTLGGDSTGFDNSLALINQVGANLTVTKADEGTWLFTGVNKYSGNTNINEGTLKIGVNDSLPTTTAVRIGTGATAGTFDLNGFSQTIGSLAVQSTSNAVTNNIIVDTGETLTINGAVTLGIDANASSTAVTASGGGNILVNSGGANFVVGGATGSTNDNKVTADFSGLASFTANLGAGTFRVGDINTGTEDSASSFRLASDNTITAAVFRVGDGAGGTFTHTLTLGNGTNLIKADLINIGSAGATIRSGGTVAFEGADTTGAVTFRASDGAGRATINMINTTGNTGGSMTATLSLTGHAADILASTVTMASRTTGSGAASADLSFDQGVLDFTTLKMASRSGAGTGNADATVTLGDSAAPGTPTTTISTLIMAVNTSAGGTVTADLNVTGGNVNIGPINMANAAMGRTATSTIDLTGGTTTVTGNITRTGGLGTENATVTLAGGALNMSDFDIGTSVAPVSLVAESGQLSNLNQLNGGSGSFTKTTAGILEMLGVSDYTNVTDVNAGTLLVTGTLSGSATVNVAVGATLGGSGAIAHNVLVAGGTLAPGSSPGTLAIGGNLGLGANSTFAVELGGNQPGDGPGLYDQANVTGEISLDSTAVLTLALINGFETTVSLSDTFFILNQTGVTPFATTFANAPEGGLVDFGNGVFANVTYLANWTGVQGTSTLNGGNDVALFNVVPEPGAITSLLGGMGMLVGLQRFRRRKS